ncbi:hypothetical protein ACHAXM_002259 [Skeletonema potamos]
MHHRVLLALIFMIGIAGISITEAFQFPKIKFVGLSNSNKHDENEPINRVKKGPEETALLQNSLEKHCNKNNVLIRWEPQITESYEVAHVIFQEMAQSANKGGCLISFPSMSRPSDLDKLSSVLQSSKCKQLLGLDSVECDLYPSSPAPYIHIKFDRCVSGESVTAERIYSTAETAASATEGWLKDFLGKYRLCPYTSSASRAAVGLSSIGVPVGGVHIQVNSRSDNATKAARTVSAFWTEVVTLMQSSQDEWATSLVVSPEYDDDFRSFVEVCDDIIEPTVVAIQATEFIGRAWFHPQYDADQVGHTSVIAGHAVPHKMVEGFMNSLNLESGTEKVETIEFEALAASNNLVRRTPHATINILRRSQLEAAAEYEKGLGVKRPKPNSIYVRNAVRLSNYR